jgi:hypothetical protein
VPHGAAGHRIDCRSRHLGTSAGAPSSETETPARGVDCAIGRVEGMPGWSDRMTARALRVTALACRGNVCVDRRGGATQTVRLTSTYRGSFTSPMSPDEKWLQATIELAIQNVHEGGGPFAAVIVAGGELMSTGQNAPTGGNDPTADAEVWLSGQRAWRGATLPDPLDPVYLVRAMPAVRIRCAPAQIDRVV